MLPSPQLERLATSHPFVQQVCPFDHSSPRSLYLSFVLGIDRHRLFIAYRAGSRIHVPKNDLLDGPVYLV